MYEMGGHFTVHAAEGDVRESLLRGKTQIQEKLGPAAEGEGEENKKSSWPMYIYSTRFALLVQGKRGGRYERGSKSINFACYKAIIIQRVKKREPRQGGYKSDRPRLHWHSSPRAEIWLNAGIADANLLSKL